MKRYICLLLAIVMLSFVGCTKDVEDPNPEDIQVKETTVEIEDTQEEETTVEDEEETKSAEVEEQTIIVYGSISYQYKITDNYHSGENIDYKLTITGFNNQYYTVNRIKDLLSIYVSVGPGWSDVPTFMELDFEDLINEGKEKLTKQIDNIINDYAEDPDNVKYTIEIGITKENFLASNTWTLEEIKKVEPYFWGTK